jgi:hypothetical protein
MRDQERRRTACSLREGRIEAAGAADATAYHDWSRGGSAEPLWCFMTEEAFGKHMVWPEHPTTKLQLGIGYSSFKEAQRESVKLEQGGYKILKITPMTLPIPNIQG